jgi:hypothetical protein
MALTVKFPTVPLGTNIAIGHGDLAWQTKDPAHQKSKITHPRRCNVIHLTSQKVFLELEVIYD